MVNGLVGYQLRRALHLFSTDFTAVFEDIGIRQVLFGILSVVGNSPGIAQGAVGRVLGIQRPNMVSLVNDLEERRLIERMDDPHDRRAFALKLTADGEEMLANCALRAHAHEERLLSRLSDTDRETLLALLRRLNGGT